MALAARVQGTQVTVNNQIVCSSLMNMCDDPTHVSIGEKWRKEAMNIRIPIIVTGNDFSTLFAPLIRDGRMDKCARTALHWRLLTAAVTGAVVLI